MKQTFILVATAALVFGPVAAMAQDAAAPASPAAPASAAAPAATTPYYSTAKSTIGDLLDNPETKAVLMKHMPLVFGNDQIDMARGMTPREIQQYAPDNITDDALNKIDADLAPIAKK